jgi:hypothetical protein
MQRPSEGQHIHVYGTDAETLHVNLQKDVCKYVFSCFPIAFACTYVRRAKGCCRTENSVGLSFLRASFESVISLICVQGEIDQENLNMFLENDLTLKRTKEYTWILCILRRVRNGLV